MTGELFAEEVRWQPGAEELIDGIRAAGTEGRAGDQLAALGGRPGARAARRSPVRRHGRRRRSGQRQARSGSLPGWRWISLGLTAGGCLAVEDSPSGTEAAVAAGIAVLVVPSEVPVPGRSRPDLRLVAARGHRRGTAAHPPRVPPIAAPAAGRVKVTVSASGPADPDVVWDRYIHPARWPEWSPQIRSVDYPDDVAHRRWRGTVHGPCGLAVSFEILDVDAEKRCWSWRVTVLGIAFDARS